jgi:hypothetical protein
MNVYSQGNIQKTRHSMVDTLARELAVTETILRSRNTFFEEIRDNIGLQEKIRAMGLSSFVLLALYGAVLGSSHSLWQALSSAFKLPLLFLATALICIPTLYFFNILFGARQNLNQNLALILTPITVTAILLFSFAAITLFFMLTTSQYQFFKLLNVVFFAVAGITGMVFLVQGMRVVSITQEEGGSARKWVLRFWILIYAFVGSQMAWTLRPFIGYPNAPFELFRQRGGNFYGDILVSIGELLGFFILR